MDFERFKEILCQSPLTSIAIDLNCAGKCLNLKSDKKYIRYVCGLNALNI